MQFSAFVTTNQQTQLVKLFGAFFVNKNTFFTAQLSFVYKKKISPALEDFFISERIL